MTDNGSGFTSQEFRVFLKNNGVRHTTLAPYHPASNRLADKVVQIVKGGLKNINNGSINTRLTKVLLAYRTTPQSTTGLTPAEMILGHKPRTHLDLIKPHIAERVEWKQEQQKATHDSKANPRSFQIGDLVYVKNFGAGHNWLPGSILKYTGPVSFLVKLKDGRERHCHQEQIRSPSVQKENESDDKSEEPEQSNFDPIQVDSPQKAADKSTTQSVSGAATTPATDTTEPVTTSANATTSTTVMLAAEAVTSSTTTAHQRSRGRDTSTFTTKEVLPSQKSEGSSKVRTWKTNCTHI